MIGLVAFHSSAAAEADLLDLTDQMRDVRAVSEPEIARQAAARRAELSTS